MVFLISGQGYFTFLYGYAKRNWEGVRKEEQTIGLGLAPSTRGGSLSHFLWANASVYSSENTHKATRNADFCWLVFSLPDFHLLTDLFCRLVSAAPFCWLCPSLDWPLIPTVFCCFLLLTDLLLTALSCRLSSSLFSWAFLPSSTSGLVGDLVHWPFVWVSRQNRFSDWHPHTQINRCHL